MEELYLQRILTKSEKCIPTNKWVGGTFWGVKDMLRLETEEEIKQMLYGIIVDGEIWIYGYVEKYKLYDVD